MAVAPRRSVLVVGTVVAVLLAAVATRLVLRSGSSAYEDALSSLPHTVLRASYTDWEAVGRLVPGPDPTASSSKHALEAFGEKAFDRDLTAESALSDTFTALASAYGITPLDGDWEVYGQARDGSVDLLRLSDDVDIDALEARFRKLGYEAPSGGAGSDGVWVGSPELVVGLPDPLTPVQQNVAVIRSERLLAMSDSASYLESAVAAAKGDQPTLSSLDGIPELLSAAGTPTVAELWASDFACEDLAMSQADPSEEEAGAELVRRVGGVHPLAGLVMAQQEDSTLRVGMVFENSDQADEDLQPRTDLATGPAPGQGGTFPDRFRVTDSVADGRTVTLTLKPVDGGLLNDLGQGPVLFATC